MRLVSAMYEDFYPFDTGIIPVFNSFNASQSADDLTTDDCLVVWGGADIPAEYYKHKCHTFGGGDRITRRDAIEWAMMNRAKELGIPIIGICRGGQMLTALAGGYLVQHLENHMGTHAISTINGDMKVNSIHHQMMVPNGVDHEMLGVAAPPRSNVYYGQEGKEHHQVEPEYIYYPAIRGFAVQWHPEMMTNTAPATQFIAKTFLERV
jgi:gamma-glutamyl-gamma-aminobutyrate hydrolase PuuD